MFCLMDHTEIVAFGNFGEKYELTFKKCKHAIQERMCSENMFDMKTQWYFQHQDLLSTIPNTFKRPVLYVAE